MMEDQKKQKKVVGVQAPPSGKLKKELFTHIPEIKDLQQIVDLFNIDWTKVQRFRESKGLRTQ